MFKFHPFASEISLTLTFATDGDEEPRQNSRKRRHFEGIVPTATGLTLSPTRSTNDCTSIEQQNSALAQTPSEDSRSTRIENEYDPKQIRNNHNPPVLLTNNLDSTSENRSDEIEYIGERVNCENSSDHENFYPSNTAYDLQTNNDHLGLVAMTTQSFDPSPEAMIGHQQFFNPSPEVTVGETQFLGQPSQEMVPESYVFDPSSHAQIGYSQFFDPSTHLLPASFNPPMGNIENTMTSLQPQAEAQCFNACNQDPSSQPIFSC